MSDKFANIYSQKSSFDFQELLKQFSIEGIHIANPSSGRVTILDDEGYQLDSSIVGIEELVDKQTYVSFQMWFDECTDLICSLRLIDDGRLLEMYSLVGLLTEELDKARYILLSRFKFKAERGELVFFVFDRVGCTAEIDWDGLSISGKYDFQLCPTSLGVPLARIDDFHICIVNGRYYQLNNYVIIEEL